MNHQIGATKQELLAKAVTAGIPGILELLGTSPDRVQDLMSAASSIQKNSKLYQFLVASSELHFCQAFVATVEGVPPNVDVSGYGRAMIALTLAMLDEADTKEKEWE